MDTATLPPVNATAHPTKSDQKGRHCACPPCHGWIKNKGAGDSARWRIGLVLGAVLCIYVGLCGRLFHIQVVQSETLTARADKQIQFVERLAPSRGSISDCSGLPLAFCHPKDTVAADLMLLNNPDAQKAAADKLAPVLNIPAETLLKKIQQRSRGVVYLARNADPEVAAKVKALKIKGIVFEDGYSRVYPQGQMACHVVGWAGLDGGMEGVEVELDSILKGTPGFLRFYRDAAKRLIALKNGSIGPAASNPPRDGLAVTLTIDARIQQCAEEELARIHEEFDPKAATCIVIDVTTGAILAMASTPKFDPNEASKAPDGHRRNRPVTDFYEPGSTFKVFVAAMALEKKMWRRHEMIDCENGAWRIGYRTLHDSHAYGGLTFDDVLSKSSNIGAAKIAQRMGLDMLYTMVRDFGFGAPTGINLPGESKGRVRPRSVWKNDSLYSIAMGHEIGTTPLQIINAFAAVVNGGVLYRPKVVQSVSNAQDEQLYTLKPQPMRRVISEATSKQMREVLARVVQPGGTGTKAFLAEWAVGGKTGTTKKWDPITKSYSSTLYIGSFCGFAPAENPRVACIVTVDEPHKGRGYYGGTVACPATREVLRKALTVLNVPPRSADEQKKAIAESQKKVLER